MSDSETEPPAPSATLTESGIRTMIREEIRAALQPPASTTPAAVTVTSPISTTASPLYVGPSGKPTLVRAAGVLIIGRHEYPPLSVHNSQQRALPLLPSASACVRSARCLCWPQTAPRVPCRGESSLGMRHLTPARFTIPCYLMAAKETHQGAGGVCQL